MSPIVLANKTLKPGQFKQIDGEFYGTPKEVWDFRTKAFAGTPRDIARQFLLANTELFELESNLEGLRVQRIIHSLGADHVILNQIHKKLRVFRGYVTVHVDKAGHVFLAKNRAVPARLLPDKYISRISREQALAKARRSLPKRGGPAALHDSERIWFPYRKSILPAYKFRLIRKSPRQDWIVYVNAKTGQVLSRYDNLSEKNGAQGLIFDPSPVIALGGHKDL